GRWAGIPGARFHRLGFGRCFHPEAAGGHAGGAAGPLPRSGGAREGRGGYGHVSVHAPGRVEYHLRRRDRPRRGAEGDGRVGDGFLAGAGPRARAGAGSRGEEEVSRIMIGDSVYQFSRSRLLPALVLLIGANAWGAATVFNVMDYGAHNDGSAPATEAIRSAIQAAKAAGGGTVYFPAGNYVTGPIELVSNLVLHIDAGATLRFPAARLPYTWGRMQGIECLTAVPLIGGGGMEKVNITPR